MHAVLYIMQDSVNYIIIVNYIRHRLLVYRTVIRVYVYTYIRSYLNKDFNRESIPEI